MTSKSTYQSMESQFHMESEVHSVVSTLESYIPVFQDLQLKFCHALPSFLCNLLSVPSSIVFSSSVAFVSGAGKLFGDGSSPAVFNTSSAGDEGFCLELGFSLLFLVISAGSSCDGAVVTGWPIGASLTGEEVGVRGLYPISADGSGSSSSSNNFETKMYNITCLPAWYSPRNHEKLKSVRAQKKANSQKTIDPHFCHYPPT